MIPIALVCRILSVLPLQFNMAGFKRSNNFYSYIPVLPERFLIFSLPIRIGCDIP